MASLEPPLSTRPVRGCRLRTPILPTPPVTPPPSLTPNSRPKPVRARSTPSQKPSSLLSASQEVSSVSLPVTRVSSPRPQPRVVISRSQGSASPSVYNTESRIRLPRRGSALGLDLEESVDQEGDDAQLRTPQTLTPDVTAEQGSAAERRRRSSTIDGRPRSQTERRFPCTHPGCDKAYFKPSRLSEHMLTHTGERPHVCETCGQSYFRQSHLAAHLRVHKGADEKRFVCPREGCGKRFWTATHMKRHEDSHDFAEQHPCTQCDAVFAKSHLLREHVAEEHMPAGTKPWLCTHAGCGRSFAMKQQLKTHERTHDPSRYTCSHPDHDVFPNFPTWTALQAHLRDAHPPVCPHEECHGRTFKNAHRLREHLKVHAEREDDLAAAGSDEDLPPVLQAKRRPRRKRRRSDADDSPIAQTAKLPRIEGGTAGKDWPCGAPGCHRAFKTKFARDEHSQAAHARGKHRCDVCGRAYRRPASLKRHQAEGWCINGGDSHAEDTDRDDSQQDIAAELLGTATAPGGRQFRPWTCPYGTHVSLHREQGGEEEDEEACEERFFRVYDVRRHLSAAHGVELEGRGTRELLLADGQRGE